MRSFWNCWRRGEPACSPWQGVTASPEARRARRTGRRGRRPLRLPSVAALAVARDGRAQRPAPTGCVLQAIIKICGAFHDYGRSHLLCTTLPCGKLSQLPEHRAVLKLFSLPFLSRKGSRRRPPVCRHLKSCTWLGTPGRAGQIRGWSRGGVGVCRCGCRSRRCLFRRRFRGGR